LEPTGRYDSEEAFVGRGDRVVEKIKGKRQCFTEKDFLVELDIVKTIIL